MESPTSASSSTSSSSVNGDGIHVDETGATGAGDAIVDIDAVFGFLFMSNFQELRVMILHLMQTWINNRNPMVFLKDCQSTRSMSSFLIRLVTLGGRSLIVTHIDHVTGLSDTEDEYDCLVCYNPSDEILNAIYRKSYPCIVHFDGECSSDVTPHLDLTLTNDMGYINSSDSETLLHEIRSRLFRT